MAAEPAPAPARPANVAAPRSRSGARDAACVTARPQIREAGENASSSSPAYTPSPAPVDSPVSAAIEPLENTTVERGPVVQEPARKLYDELVIPADSVIGLQVENAVTTERAKVEDRSVPE